MDWNNFNWEMIIDFLELYWPTIAGGLLFLLSAIFPKNTSLKKFMAKKAKKLRKVKRKNLKLENKLKEGLQKQANLEKELEA